jgi:solute:Na+ symporter, SSS family
MNFPIFISVLFLIQIICLFIGSKIAKKVNSQEDYFLAGKGLGFFPLLMTFIATQIGGGMILGATEEAYQYGWYVFFYPLGAALGFILLSLGLGKKMYQYKVSTIAQIFEVVYRSKRLKQVASLLSIISLFMIFVGQMIASKKFMVSMGFDHQAVFVACWVIVIVYTIMGGLQAVVATDILQALFFIAVFFGCFAYALMTSPVDVSSVIQSGWDSETFSFNSEKFCGWLLMPLLFMIIEQDMGQRCFAAKSGRTVAWAAAGAALCIIAVSVIPLFFGILGKQMGIEAVPGSSILMTSAIASTTPVLAALMGCAVLVAIISTADSLINAISSNLTQDFELPFANKSVMVARIITALISFCGIFVSFYFNNVVDLLILSYELSISCLFVSVFAAMFNKKGEWLSATLSIGFGAVAFVVFRYVAVPIPKEIASLLCSSLGYGLGELYVRYLPEKRVSTVE